MFLLKGVTRAPRLPDYLRFARRPAITVLDLYYIIYFEVYYYILFFVTKFGHNLKTCKFFFQNFNLLHKCILEFEEETTTEKFSLKIAVLKF